MSWVSYIVRKMVAATNIKFFLINLITQNNFVDEKNLHQFYPTIWNLPFRFIAASTMERNKKFSEEEEEEELNQNESISLRISFYFHLEINKL